jgi:replicative DNA helicase
MEMSNTELACRTLAHRASVPLHAITGTRQPSQAELENMLAVSPTGQGKIYLIDQSNLSAAEIARIVRREIRKHKVEIIFIDYLQRMKHDRDAGESTTRQVGETAKMLKTLARDCDIPVVCLAQLNREVTTRNDGKPRLSDLRDSGEIEQEADCVILLHAHPMDEQNTSVQQIDLLVEKQRNGPTSCASMTYRRPYTRFEDGPPYMRTEATRQSYGGRPK